MVALIRSWRTRFRLRMVWMLTRHPRFQPLYHADVVSYDPLEQAQFLASAGYYAAAAMMARNAIECRFKRLCLLTPEWRTLRKDKFCRFVGFLKTHGWIGGVIANKADRFYSMASSLAHGENVTYARCQSVIEDAVSLSKSMDNATQQVLRKGKKADSQLTDWAPLVTG